MWVAQVRHSLWCHVTVDHKVNDVWIENHGTPPLEILAKSFLCFLRIDIDRRMVSAFEEHPEIIFQQISIATIRQPITEDLRQVPMCVRPEHWFPCGEDAFGVTVFCRMRAS